MAFRNAVAIRAKRRTEFERYGMPVSCDTWSHHQALMTLLSVCGQVPGPVDRDGRAGSGARDLPQDSRL